MAWVDRNDCIGCQICVNECPVDTIRMKDNIAMINMENCIRCGLCHSVCPEGAVKHDSEKIPEEVQANIALTKEYMEACAKYLGSKEEKQKCLKRMIKHFTKDKNIAERTLDKLKAMQQ